MNKRIRYVKEADGTVKSMQYIKANDESEYIVHLDNEKLVGYIYKVGDTGCVASSTGSSSHKLKIAVKKELIRLGCVFEPETRTKGKVHEAVQS